LSVKKELKKLSKSELVRLLLKERKMRQDLEERLIKIEHYLKAFDNPHTPSSKKRKNNTKKIKIMKRINLVFQVSLRVAMVVE